MFYRDKICPPIYNMCVKSLQHFCIRPDGAGSRPTDCKSASFCFISIPWIAVVKTHPRLRRCPWKTHSYRLQTLCGHVHCHRYHNSNYKFWWDLILYIFDNFYKYLNIKIHYIHIGTWWLQGGNIKVIYRFTQSGRKPCVLLFLLLFAL